MPIRRNAVLATVALALAAPVAHAKEVDQFSDRRFELAHLRDAAPALDARMATLLAQLARDLTAAHATTRAERDAVVYHAFQTGPIELVAQLVTPFESWARDHARIDLFVIDHRGVYGGAIDYDDMGLGWYVEISPVIKLGPRVIGLDKIGHFIGQGWFYYAEGERLRAAEPNLSPVELRARVLKYGHDLEVGYLGLAGTGVYSPADLAANAAGMAFYAQLFDGPNPYFAVDRAGHYQQIRAFHFTDYATDSWDEVLNPSRPRSAQLYAEVAAHMQTAACPAYLDNPVAYLHATGVNQDAYDYLWSGAMNAKVFPFQRRFDITQICRAAPAAPPASPGARSTAPPVAR